MLSIVKDNPYWAEVESCQRWTLPHGEMRTRTFTGLVARDSAGGSFYQCDFGPSGALPAEIAIIRDPEHQTVYLVDREIWHDTLFVSGC